jgi:hypothetical protein
MQLELKGEVAMTKKPKPPCPLGANFKERFAQRLAERPKISDEEFMRETEAEIGPDGEYVDGPGIAIVCGTDQPMTFRELAEDGFMHDFEWNDSLFSAWHYDGVRPESLPHGFEDMKESYERWLARVESDDG